MEQVVPSSSSESQNAESVMDDVELHIPVLPNSSSSSESQNDEDSDQMLYSSDSGSNNSNSTSDSQNGDKILHVAFNGDCSHFVCGYDNGVVVLRCYPCRKVLKLGLSGAAIRIAEMESRCDNGLHCRLALVGNGLLDSQFSSNKVWIWDQKTDSIVGYKAFSENIVGVRLRKSRIVIILKDSVIVLRLPDLSQSHNFQALNNETGLCEISQGSSIVLVYPPIMRGNNLTITRLDDSRPPLNLLIDGLHDIACFALSMDGRIIATASVQGISVRVFDTEDGNFLQEVTNEDWNAIYRLAINPENELLAVLNHRGVVCILRLKADPEKFGEAFSSIFGGELQESGGLVIKEYRLEDKFEYVIGFGAERSLLALDLYNSFYQCEEFGMGRCTYL